MDISTLPADSWEALSNGVSQVISGFVAIFKWLVSKV